VEVTRAGADNTVALQQRLESCANSCRFPVQMAEDDSSSACERTTGEREEELATQEKKRVRADGLRESPSFLIPVPSHNTLHAASSDDARSEVEVRFPCLCAQKHASCMSALVCVPTLLWAFLSELPPVLPALATASRQLRIAIRRSMSTGCVPIVHQCTQCGLHHAHISHNLLGAWQSDD
jgi:hypothetical protein